MAITLLHLIMFVLFVFWMVVMYSIMTHGSGRCHRDGEEERHHWPYHHA